MASITLEGVSKEFPGGAVAVSDLDLSIGEGEFLVLVGPSGSGKTTVLRMVAGLEECTTGVIRIGERIVNHLAPRDRDIAMVFQNYALYPHMSVYDNMAFGLKLRKVERAEIRRRVTEAADLLGLADLLGRRPRALSGGQRQRVAMGRAIVREPAAFLMDEPLSNLDAKLRVQMRAEISRLHQRLATTTMYVTHDQTEALTMADRVAVMRDGVLQQVDVPQVLYDDPVNRFVAGFIGSPAMNFITGQLVGGADGDGGGVAVTFAGHRLEIPAAVLEHRPAARSRLGGEVLVGLRPEDLGDSAFAPPSPPERVLDVTVTLAEPLGSEVVGHFDVGGANWVARLHPRTAIRAGDVVKLAVDTERIHLFDPASGASLRVGH